VTIATIVYLTLLGIGAAAYALFTGLILKGFARLRRSPQRPSSYRPSVSVVVPARNEEAVIGETLASLLAQDYPPDRFEIVVVDDRSTDGTADVVRDAGAHAANLCLVRQTRVDPTRSPKKQALAGGVRAAKGEVIMMTDADCFHHPQWISGAIERMKREVGMVVGQARFALPPDAPLWQRMQALDFRAQGLCAAGLVAAGRPLTCSGASLAVRRVAFEAVKGYEGVDHYTSGDDELLMAKIAATEWRIAATSGEAAVVMTRPPTSLKDLWNQRLRWASKTSRYRGTEALILGGVFLFYVMLMLAPLTAWLRGAWWPLTAIFVAKVWLDQTVIVRGLRLFEGGRLRWFDFLMAELFHPPFIVAAVLGGRFGTFRWKDESYEHGRAVKRD